MHTIDIEVFPIARTALDVLRVKEWLSHVGAKEFELPSVTDCEALIGLGSKRCYKSFELGLNPNVTKIRKDWTVYLDNILKSGHGSVLEHATWTWAIEGVSRVFTGEMNRHRAGVSISEGSMRYIRFDDIAFWMPKSIEGGDAGVVEKMYQWNDHQTLKEIIEIEKSEPEMSLEKKKAVTRAIFLRAFKQMENNYTLLCQLWEEEIAPGSKFSQKKQLTSMFRRIIGMGVATGGIWTMNIRALRHIIALRSHPAAEEEIAYVMGKIGKTMVEEETRLFGDFEQDSYGFWVPRYPKV